MDPQPLQLDYSRTLRRGDPLSDRRERGWLREMLRWMLSMSVWSFAALILLSVPISLLFFLTGPILGFPATLVLVLLIPAAATAIRSVRRRRAAAVLGYVQQAIRLNLPLNRLIAAAAISDRGPVAQRLLALQDELESGSPLSDALAYSTPELSSRTIGLIRFAERSGRLLPTLDRLLNEMLGESRRVQDNQALAAWYPPVLLLISGACITFLAIFVFPRLQLICQDFKIELPSITRWIIGATSLSLPLLPVVMALLLALLVFACALKLRETFRGRPSTWLFRGLRGRILWMLPLYRGLLRDRAMTDICAALADAVELGHPFDEALREVQQLDVNIVMQRKLDRWADAVRTGALPGDAAAVAGMPKFLVGMLGHGKVTSDLGDVFRFVSRFYGSRFMRLRELLRGAYLPFVTILMGMVVATIALALFMPMRQFIMQVGIRWSGP